MRGLASLLCCLLRSCKFELTATLERSRRWFSPSILVLLQTHTPGQMGCCTSKASVEEDDPLTGTGICQKQLYPPHISPTGLQVELTPNTRSVQYLAAIRFTQSASAAAGPGFYSQLGSYSAIRRVLHGCAPRQQHFPCFLRKQQQ